MHRCGRAGRKQSLSGEVSLYPPTVFSFFPREFRAMADSTMELLKACNQWVDPNLLELTKERKKKEQPPSAAKSANNESGEIKSANESGGNQPSATGGKKKRRKRKINEKSDEKYSECGAEGHRTIYLDVLLQDINRQDVLPGKN